MKKYLLLLVAASGLSLGTLHAQSIPTMRARQPFELPQALQRQLEKVGLPATTAQRSSTVRKPGKATTYGWNFGANQWLTTASVEAFTYDSKGRFTQIVELDSATQRPDRRLGVSYSTANNQTISLHEGWNGTAWENQSRTVQTLNSRNYLTEFLEQVWVNGAWQNSFRLQVEHDAYGHYVQFLNEQWVNTAWVTTYGQRATVTYTAAGAVEQETETTLNTTTNVYEPFVRTLYTYPSPASLDYSVRISQGRGNNGVWVNQQRVANVTRDAQGRETSSETEVWTNGAWQLNNRMTTIYLSNGGKQGLDEQRQNNAWVGTGRYTHSFDNQGNELGYVSEVFANNAWSVQEAYRYILRYNPTQDLVTRIRQNYDTTTKSYYSSLKHVYSDFQSITLGMKPNAALAAETQLYPNPTTDRVTLELPGQGIIRAEVVNSLGQVVPRLTLQPKQGHTELNLSAQQPGVYTVQLYTAAGLVVKKVVRQ